MIDLYLLGASGSIGRQTIDIISNYKKQFRIVAMSVGHDLSLAQDLVDKVKPELVCLRNESDKINTTAKIQSINIQTIILIIANKTLTNLLLSIFFMTNHL